MDAANVSAVIAEACRVLKPGGFLQFSISHPLLDVPHHKNLRGADGRTYAYEVGGYFTSLQGEVAEWIFSAAPPEVVQGAKIPCAALHPTLSQWLNMLIDQGFVIERVAEPFPDDETVARAAPISRTPGGAVFPACAREEEVITVQKYSIRISNLDGMHKKN